MRKKVSYFQNPASAHQAKEKAQWIAFAPVVFKTTLALRNFGVLKAIYDSPNGSLSFDELKAATGLSDYGLRILVGSGLQCAILEGDDSDLSMTDTGFFVLTDPMTTVNLDFINDVCYRGLDALEASIANGKPEGLKELGNWPTVYEGMSKLEPKVLKSWLAFDHFYSDDAFQEVLPYIFKYAPKRIMDIGGNTGKFSMQCLGYNANVHMTIVDLPGQIGMAQKNLSGMAGYERMHFAPADMLDAASVLPLDHDAIWMSQFLDCFSPDEIVSILHKCKAAMRPDTKVFIMEPLIDRQAAPANSFCVELTSPYFTTIANGNSRMYRSADMLAIIERAGLQVQEMSPIIGICQTVITCTL